MNIYKAICKDGSYVCNCFLKRRKDDSSDHIFSMKENGESITAHLNGYAIISFEEYCELTGETFDLADKIKEFDENFQRTANK